MHRMPRAQTPVYPSMISS